MNSRELLKNAGFTKQNESGEDSCLFCDYYHLDSQKSIASCELHGVRFWDDFSAGEYVCKKFNGSNFDTIVDLLKDNSNSSNDTSSKQGNSSSQKEGCYIATAVYGDYNAPEVLVLRKFRDNVLKRSSLGRLFIKAYYAISPRLACKLKSNTFLNSKIKLILDRIVTIIDENE